MQEEKAPVEVEEAPAKPLTKTQRKREKGKRDIAKAMQAADPNARIEGVGKKLEKNDMVILRSARFTHQNLKHIQNKIKKCYPHWDGVILHLQPEESIERLNLGAVQAIYEAYMSRFDPDLFKIRQERKRIAELTEQQQKKKDEMQTAQQAADYLEKVVEERDNDKAKSVEDATRRLESIKQDNSPGT